MESRLGAGPFQAPPCTLLSGSSESLWSIITWTQGPIRALQLTHRTTRNQPTTLLDCRFLTRRGTGIWPRNHLVLNRRLWALRTCSPGRRSRLPRMDTHSSQWSICICCWFSWNLQIPIPWAYWPISQWPAPASLCPDSFSCCPLTVRLKLLANDCPGSSPQP